MDKLIKTLQEFNDLKWGLAIESVKDLNKTIEAEMVSGNNPLGTLLELLNFYNGDSLRDALVLLSETGVVNVELERDYLLEYGIIFGELVNQYHGLSLDESVSLFQNLERKELVHFVCEWRKEQVDRPKWNPDYAPKTKLNRNVAAFCRENSLIKVIHEFNINNDPRNLLFPFDGWELARYFKLSYER